MRVVLRDEKDIDFVFFVLQNITQYDRVILAGVEDPEHVVLYSESVHHRSGSFLLYLPRSAFEEFQVGRREIRSLPANCFSSVIRNCLVWRTENDRPNCLFLETRNSNSNFRLKCRFLEHAEAPQPPAADVSFTCELSVQSVKEVDETVHTVHVVIDFVQNRLCIDVETQYMTVQFYFPISHVSVSLRYMTHSRIHIKSGDFRAFKTWFQLICKLSKLPTKQEFYLYNDATLCCKTMAHSDSQIFCTHTLHLQTSVSEMSVTRTPVLAALPLTDGMQDDPTPVCEIPARRKKARKLTQNPEP